MEHNVCYQCGGSGCHHCNTVQPDNATKRIIVDDCGGCSDGHGETVGLDDFSMRMETAGTCKQAPDRSNEAFLCQCGSCTFNLLRDAKIECSKCQTIINERWVTHADIDPANLPRWHKDNA